MTMISGPPKLWIRAALISVREVVSALLSILLRGRLL
jgi:hypothetical protein